MVKDLAIHRVSDSQVVKEPEDELKWNTLMVLPSQCIGCWVIASLIRNVNPSIYRFSGPSLQSFYLFSLKTFKLHLKSKHYYEFKMLQFYPVSKEGKDCWLKVTIIHLPEIKCGVLHVEASFNRKLGLAALTPLSVTSLVREYNISIHLFTRVIPMHR